MARESVRSLKDIGALRGACITDAKAEEMLAFISQFQRRNNGATPTIRAMANELGVPEEAVRILLARMENKGRIHFVSRIGPVIMVIGPDTKLPHDPGLSQTGLPPAREGAYERFLSVEGLRMKLGRFIADNERQGKPTSLRAMMDFVGYDNAAYVARMAEILRERGLIHYGHGIQTKLTEHGRNFFGVKTMQTEEVHMNGNDRPVVVVREGGGKSKHTFKQRVHAMMTLLAAEAARTGDPKVMMKQADVAEAMGYNRSSNTVIVELARDARRLGYLAEQPPGAHGFKLTEKGLGMFGPNGFNQQRGKSGRPELAGDTQPDPGKVDSFEHDHDTRFLSEDHVADAVGLSDYRPPERLERAIIEATEPVMSLDLVRRAVAVAPTEKLLMELIERGYIVRKG